VPSSSPSVNRRIPVYAKAAFGRLFLLLQRVFSAQIPGLLPCHILAVDFSALQSLLFVKYCPIDINVFKLSFKLISLQRKCQRFNGFTP
jgi:hypothetical protein